MSNKPRVLVTRVIPDAGLRLIKEHCDAEVWLEQLPPPAEYLRARAADCDGLVTLLTDTIDAALLEASPRLRVVSNFAVGFNNVDVAAATRLGVAVGNTPGALTDSTADTALALMLAAGRRIVEGADDARAGRWKTWEPRGWLGQDFTGGTLGVVGMGRIGFALARRCRRAFDMRVLYTGNSPKPEADDELDARHVGLDELLRESDFVSVHAALNDQTRGLFGAAQFAAMKPTAVFVNTARGGHVDQQALFDALTQGTIFAAGLDVTDPEPLPADHPLLTLPNCVVTPHLASATVGTRDRMARLCADNLLAGLAGRPLRHCVNPGYEANRRGDV